MWTIPFLLIHPPLCPQPFFPLRHLPHLCPQPFPLFLQPLPVFSQPSLPPLRPLRSAQALRALPPQKPLSQTPSSPQFFSHPFQQASKPFSCLHNSQSLPPLPQKPCSLGR